MVHIPQKYISSYKIFQENKRRKGEDIYYETTASIRMLEQTCIMGFSAMIIFTQPAYCMYLQMQYVYTYPSLDT